MSRFGVANALTHMKTQITIRPLFLALLLMTIVIGSKAGEGGGPLVAGAVFGGSANEHITGSARLANGDVVVCGWTDSYDLQVDVPGFKTVSSGGEEAFVAVLSEDLQTIKAFTFYGDEYQDKATCVGVDPNGRIVLVGETESIRLPMSTGSISQVYSNGIDGFIAVFNTSLTTLLRATYINGIGDEHPMATAVDAAGSIYICGTTTSNSGFPTNNGYDRTYNGGVDGFLMRVDGSLSIMQFSTYFGSENDDIFTALNLTPDGAIAVTGSTTSSSYETYPKVNPQQWWVQKDRPYDWSYNGGLTDAVLTMFSQDGAQLVVSTFFGGSGSETGRAVFYDSRGRIIIVGESNSLDIPIVGGLQSAPRGNTDVFAALFSDRGRSLAGSTYFGGTGTESVSRVVPESDDIWVVAGTTSSRDLPMIGAGATSDLRGGTDGFIAKVGIAVTTFSSTIGWAQDESLRSCFLDDKGDLFISGSTTSTRITLDRDELPTSGGTDAMIVKWAFGSLSLTAPRGGERLCVGQSMNMNWNTTEMGPLEPFVIERSEDGSSWTTIIDGVKGRSYQWRPTANDTSTRGSFIRLRTLRGHISVSSDRIIIDPQVRIEPLPQTVSACLGSKFSLTLVATGKDLRYTWRRNGVALMQQEATLVLDPVTASTAGRYECYVLGGCGQAVTSSIMTIVVPSAPSFTLMPASLTVADGAVAELRAQATPGSEISWFRVGRDQAVGSGPILRFSSATQADAGRYWCIAATACDTAVSDTVDLTIGPLSVLDEQQGAPSLAIFPNPASNSVRIALEQGINELTISTPLGATVRMASVEQDLPGSVEINTSDLPAGVYQVIVRGDHGKMRAGRLLIVR